MLVSLERLFQNIEPFVIEIGPALGAVFVLSFVVGWMFARRSARRSNGREC